MNRQTLIALLVPLLRHALTGAGFAGIAVSESETNEIASAAAIVIGLVWSYMEKRAAARKATPPAGDAAPQH